MKFLSIYFQEEEDLTVARQEMHEERQKILAEICNTLNNILNVIIQTSEILIKLIHSD